MIGVDRKNPFLDVSALSLHGRVAPVLHGDFKNFLGVAGADSRPPVFPKVMNVRTNRISERRLSDFNKYLEEERDLRKQGFPGYVQRPSLPILKYSE